MLSDLFRAGVAAADPYEGTKAALPDTAPTAIIAVGKASRRMAEAALERFPGTPALVVTVAGADAPVEGATVMVAGHPVPDDGGAAAAQEVWDRAGALGQGDRLLVLVSGGASAMLPLPADGLTLSDKIEVSRLLLGSGADIEQMNLVRQQLSGLKGGGLARRAAPATVEALILSDVIGDTLSVIGSGPTVAPLGTPTEARAMLAQFDLWSRVPEAVRSHLETARAPDPMPAVTNRLIGSNGKSLAAMARAAEEAAVLSRPLEGDVADAARIVVSQSTPGLTLWGGETTVRLGGSGLGGRNQELALRIAFLAEVEGWTDWACLCGGTDGRDGPTDAAGGLVDAGTLDRIRAAGLDPEALLADNDSYRALDAAGDLLKIGATGTNVADLGILWRG
ncbi:glycerate kinase type-2 family protein [Pelagovum pacificum]|uniref:glycerate kinase type-2 family protein n=1 Tax=Pelagovum pacificum TaxID=2588711 RepID=UPI001E3C291C|nr:DUF4147 domain-containing protein [Pelagovum pacificum]